MAAEIPLEAPRSARARLAVRPLAIGLAWLVAGPTPAVAWLAANAFFLNCRDAVRQACIAAAAIVLALGSRFALLALFITGAFGDAELTREQVLLVSLGKTFGVLVLSAAALYLVLRQRGPADYLRSLEGRISWGLPGIAALAVARYAALPLLGAGLAALIVELLIL